ncbi:hypothetical protein [Paenibacillus pedocola]|uniref:hypothetical protein n=1 Tax=Paenibacillus pedocola TaxID=3242193 RepID=UPI002877BD84|nr:hypothetical protein [Paenibacillus typhae]
MYPRICWGDLRARVKIPLISPQAGNMEGNRGKNPFDFGAGWRYGEIKGKNPFDFVAGGQYGGNRGKNPFDFVAGGQYGEIKGKNPFDFVAGGHQPSSPTGISPPALPAPDRQPVARLSAGPG